MDFEPSDGAKELSKRVREFMDEHIYPNEMEIEAALDREVDAATPFPEILIGIREEAKAAGLWNLFLPDAEDGPGLSNLDYGIVNEEIGRASRRDDHDRDRMLWIAGLGAQRRCCDAKQ